MQNSVRKHFRERLMRGEYIRWRARDLPAKHVGGRLLEIGCGARPAYAWAGSEFYGLDATREMTQVLKTRFPTCNVIVGDARTLPFRDKMFDIVVLSFLLHHLVSATPKGCIKNMRDAMLEARRVMSDRAVAYVREVIIRNRALSLIAFYITALCAKLHIDMDFLDIHSGVIAYFLTEKMFRKLCAEFRLEKLSSGKKWIFKFLGKYDVEFSLVKEVGSKVK